jgi:hypothetical protein
MRWWLPAAGAVFLWVLGCSGAASPAPPVDVIELPEGVEVIVQTANGLWAADGRKIADLGGADFADVYLIDASQEAFFLLSDKARTVRVARRHGSQLTIDVVLEDATVRRPIGDVALVSSNLLGHVVIDLKGKVLLEQVFFDAYESEEPPVDRPEYWWLTDYFQRPAPMCAEDHRACGWVGPSGSWLAKGRPPSRRTMLTELTSDGMTWFNLAGEGQPVPAVGHSFRGAVSEGLALVAGVLMEGGRPVSRTSVVEVATGKVTPVASDVQWGNSHYVFHQGLVAVRLEHHPHSPGSFDAAYLDSEGRVVIGPDQCTGLAPSGPFHDDRALHCVGDEYWLIDRSGARLAGPWPKWKANSHDRNSYFNGLHFSDGLAAVPVEGGFAYIDRSGDVVLAGPYEIARPFRLGFASVKDSAGVQVIGKDGMPMF